MNRPVLYRALFLRGLTDGIVECRGHEMPNGSLASHEKHVSEKILQCNNTFVQGAKSPHRLRYCRI